MLNKLCEPEHLVIIILVLLTALLVVGAGKGGGKLLLQLLKKVFGREEVNINLGGGDMAGKSRKECETCSLMVDSAKCIDHKSEHDRSMRNEEGIKELVGDLKKTREQLFGKLDTMERVMTEVRVAVGKLVVVLELHPGGRGGKAQ